MGNCEIIIHNIERYELSWDRRNDGSIYSEITGFMSSCENPDGFSIERWIVQSWRCDNDPCVNGQVNEPTIAIHVLHYVKTGNGKWRLENTDSHVCTWDGLIYNPIYSTTCIESDDGIPFVQWLDIVMFNKSGIGIPSLWTPVECYGNHVRSATGWCGCPPSEPDCCSPDDPIVAGAIQYRVRWRSISRVDQIQPGIREEVATPWLNGVLDVNNPDTWPTIKVVQGSYNVEGWEYQNPRGHDGLSRPVPRLDQMIVTWSPPNSSAQYKLSEYYCGKAFYGGEDDPIYLYPYSFPYEGDIGYVRNTTYTRDVFVPNGYYERVDYGISVISIIEFRWYDDGVLKEKDITNYLPIPSQSIFTPKTPISGQCRYTIRVLAEFVIGFTLKVKSGPITVSIPLEYTLGPVEIGMAIVQGPNIPNVVQNITTDVLNDGLDVAIDAIYGGIIKLIFPVANELILALTDVNVYTEVTKTCP